MLPKLAQPVLGPAEARIGLRDPLQYYPLFENAIRHRDHRSITEHQGAIADQWSRFSGVAATNPHAWLPVAMTADQISVPGPRNRMVCFPYTKFLSANIEVDMASAVIVCSAGLATRLSIPSDRWDLFGRNPGSRPFRLVLHPNAARLNAYNAALETLVREIFQARGYLGFLPAEQHEQ